MLTAQKSQQLSTTSAMPLGDYRTKNELWSELQSSKLAPAIPSVCDSLPDGPDHPEVAATLNDLGNAHGALGDPRTKKDFLERVLKIEERHFGADRPEVAATLNDIGNALGRLSHKERIMERASIFKARSSNSFCVRWSPRRAGPSRSRSNSQRPRQCPWSLGRPSHKEGLFGASLED